MSEVDAARFSFRRRRLPRAAGTALRAARCSVARVAGRYAVSARADARASATLIACHAIGEEEDSIAMFADEASPVSPPPPTLPPPNVVTAPPAFTVRPPPAAGSCFGVTRPSSEGLRLIERHVCRFEGRWVHARWRRCGARRRSLICVTLRASASARAFYSRCRGSRSAPRVLASHTRARRSGVTLRQYYRHNRHVDRGSARRGYAWRRHGEKWYVTAAPGNRQEPPPRRKRARMGPPRRSPACLRRVSPPASAGRWPSGCQHRT